MKCSIKQLFKFAVYASIVVCCNCTLPIGVGFATGLLVTYFLYS